jgi:hypothetical protein
LKWKEIYWIAKMKSYLAAIGAMKKGFKSDSWGKEKWDLPANEHLIGTPKAWRNRAATKKIHRSNLCPSGTPGNHEKSAIVVGSRCELPAATNFS